MPEQNQVVTFKSDGLVGGEQALREVVVALNQSAGAGAAAEVRSGSSVFDSNGKLVRAEIVPPSAANATQITEALQNPGVAEVQACFPQLQLNDISLIATGVGFPTLVAGNTIEVQTEGSALIGVLGILGSGDVYTDQPSLSTAGSITIIIQNVRNLGDPARVDLVIPSGATITLSHLGGPAVFTFGKALTLKAPGEGVFVQYLFYADDQGNLIAQLGLNADGAGKQFTEIPQELDYLVACQDSLRDF